MATSASYILQLRAAKDLVEVLTNPIHAQLYALIKAYFTPFCDCDVRLWLIAQITANNQPVKDAIKALIAGRTPDPAPIVTAALSSGYLVETFCQNNNLMGRYYSGTAGTSPPTLETLLITNHPSCQPANEYFIKDSLMDDLGKLLFDHIPEIGDVYIPPGNTPNQQHRIEFVAGGANQLNTEQMTWDPSDWYDPGYDPTALMRRFEYINLAEIDEVNVEHGITLRTGITASKPDFPPLLRLWFSSRMEKDLGLPTTDQEREQIHFHLEIKHDVNSSEGPQVNWMVHWDNDTKTHFLNDAYQSMYGQMSSGEKAQHDNIAGWPKILTRRMDPANGTGYEIKIKVRMNNGIWELYINDRYVMEQNFFDAGDPGTPFPIYQAGMGLATMSRLYDDGSNGPFNFKTLLRDYYVRRLADTGQANLTWMMLSQSDFERGDQAGGDFGFVTPDHFFVLGKQIEDRNTGSTPTGNEVSYLDDHPLQIIVPFKIGGVPSVNGVPDYSGITFKFWTFPDGGTYPGMLLPMRVEVPIQNIDFEIGFDSTTGQGVIINPSPEITGFGHMMMSVHYDGVEYLSAMITMQAPVVSSGFYGRTNVGFENSLFYPYGRFQLLY